MRGNGIVWRALEAARRRNLEAAGEAMPVKGASGATRRAVLRAMAAAGMAGALPRPAAARAPGRVAIIGGGIAGLSALHHLRKAGVDAFLYEGRTRTGGRMHTHRSGEWAFEAGGQLVNTDHYDMHALLKRYGVALLDRKSEPHDTLILADGRLVSDAELATALRPIAAQIGRDADRLDRDHARVAPGLDRLSIHDYLERHAAQIRAPWVRQLLEATSRTEYGVEPNRASAIELIFNLPTVDGRRAEVLGGADERYVIEGGSSALVEAISAVHADRIATGKRLHRVEPGLKLHFLDGSAADADTLNGADAASLEESQEIVTALANHDVDSTAHASLELDASQITTGMIDNARLNLGDGGGLDADTVDGLDSTAFIAVPAGAMVLGSTNNDTALSDAGYTFAGTSLTVTNDGGLGTWSMKEPSPSARTRGVAVAVDGLAHRPQRHG
ncbi:MAG: FAD-dependent oxidoreductase, partial [Proteobacteria bacterium]|nr:FAD-dependent oxidoreductase [Pseudomonadota bacterium]